MQYKNISVVGLIILVVAFVSACSDIRKDSKDIFFCELNKDIQDTLLSINQKVLEEDYSPQAMIDFSGNCKLIEKHIGPWTIRRQIKDTVNHISISLPANTPIPYIVYGKFIYYPYDYNLYVTGFHNKTKFRAIRIK